MTLSSIALWMKPASGCTKSFDTYASALGRCLLTYNQLDYQLEKVIGLTLKQLSAPELPPKTGFVDRVKYLEELKLTKAGQPIASIRIREEALAINEERGHLAHAHFEASPNPGDDSYRLVKAGAGKVLEYDAPKIEGLSQRIDKLTHQLLVAECRLGFCSVLLAGERLLPIPGRAGDSAETVVR
jgi:hypothetical protein